MSEFSVNPPPRLAGAGSAPNVVTAVIPDAPRQLGLSNGTIIKGVVQGRDPDGLLIVVTDKGALKLSTPANIPTGSQVTLEIRAAGDRMQVIVLSIDGHATHGTSSQGPRTGAAPPVTTPTGQAPAPPPSTAPLPAPVAIAGSVLHGTIVQAAPDALSQLMRSLLPGPLAAQPVVPATQSAALPIPPALPGLPGAPVAPGSTPVAPTQATTPALPGLPGAPVAPGQATPPSLTQPNTAGVLPAALVSSLQSDVRTKIEALFLAAPAAPAAKGGSAPATPGFSTPALTPDISDTLSNLKLPSLLSTGAEVRLRLIAISSVPGQPVAITAAAPGTPHVMAGRIIGYTPAGNAVLHSPLGAIILQGQLSLPVGTELSLAIEPVLPGAAAMPLPGTLSLSQLLLARGWPSLADAIGLLRQHASEADTLAVLSRLPQTGPKLAAGLMAAMQAIRTNDVEALLGVLVSARTSGAREDAVRKLRQEFAQVSTLAQDRPGIDWRCCFIPILDDGTVRQINLFYRRDRHQDSKDGKEEKAGTRFIVEVDMSRMGPFQFDGLVREKHFNLMVRSQIALPAKFRHDIAELFQEALLLGDYRGGLVFQKVKEFPVSPLEEIEKSATRVSA